MFRHCVLLRFSESTSADQRENVRAAIAALPDQIPEIVNYTVGLNAGDREDNYDLAAVGDFASKADYDVYASHPAHVEVISSVIAPAIVERSAIQFEY